MHMFAAPDADCTRVFASARSSRDSRPPRGSCSSSTVTRIASRPTRVVSPLSVSSTARSSSGATRRSPLRRSRFRWDHSQFCCFRTRTQCRSNTSRSRLYPSRSSCRTERGVRRPRSAVAFLVSPICHVFPCHAVSLPVTGCGLMRTRMVSRRSRPSHAHLEFSRANRCSMRSRTFSERWSSERFGLAAQSRARA